MGKILVSIGILAVVLVIVGMFFFMSTSRGNSDVVLVELENPAEGLSIEEAVEVFDEEFVFYLMASVGAQNLHNPPLSRNKPKIEVDVGDESYSVVVEKGNFAITRGEMEDEDLYLQTTKEEAIKMMGDKKEIQESFGGGRSSVELKAGKSELFAKGYLNLYTELTGKSITGNVVRIYAE
jgi:hypothetical protein